MEEIFPLVDEEGQVIGSASRSVCHNGSKLLHPVIHLHLMNEKGDLFLQKRALSKDIQPGKWDTSVGGHIDAEETVEDALAREAFEELGATGYAPVSLGKYVFESEVEKELVYSYQAFYEGPFVLHPDEISEGRFWSREEIRSHLGKQVFTPNFESEFLRYFQ